MTEPHVGYSKDQIAHAVSAGHHPRERRRHRRGREVLPTVRPRGDEMHDVFIVISEGSGGEHIARTVYAASEDDARQAYQENYADEPIVAVHQ